MNKQSQEGVRAKVPTGIAGFDEISGGGLPRGRTTLVMGGAGSGKTVFALQSLVNACYGSKEAGIFVAFEESARQIVSNAATFGWDLPALEKKNLFFLDARLSPEVVKAGAFDLIGMLTILQAKADEMNATRVVFDGIDVLLSLLDDPAAERREIYRIRDWLAQREMTGIITQKSDGEAGPRYSFLQFMADCVVILGHKVTNGAAFRNLRVMKYRGSGFLGDEFSISLTSEGMQLRNRGPAELKYAVSKELISSGVPRLDTMLRGGYYRGSSVLVSGAPGTAKSTLSGIFAAAACQRGERTLYVSFDEGADQIVRNLGSVGIRLAPHIKSGVLKMYSTRARGFNLEDQFSELRTQVRAHRPRCLVIDPLSALSTNVSSVGTASAAEQFLDFIKSEGITALNTSLMDGLSSNEATATGISTIADTWIHLSYLVQDGERNRALTIVKSRGAGHSNQVRELILSDEGISLSDVFISQGKVLMGVARWEWEREEQAASRRAQAATEHKRDQLKLRQTEAAARLKVIETEMEARDVEMAALADATGSEFDLHQNGQAMLRKLRQADEVHAGRPAAPSGKVKGRRRAV